MIEVIVLRSKNQSKYHTIGNLFVIDYQGSILYNCHSLERGGGGNEIGFNRTLAGSYDMVFEWSPRFNMYLWELKGTGFRSEMKIHSANYWHQLNGCTAVGKKLADIDNDGYLDVTSSKLTLKEFHEILKPYQKEKVKITYVDPV